MGPLVEEPLFYTGTNLWRYRVRIPVINYANMKDCETIDHSVIILSPVTARSFPSI